VDDNGGSLDSRQVIGSGLIDSLRLKVNYKMKYLK
jgi:hypothetical protein